MNPLSYYRTNASEIQLKALSAIRHISPSGKDKKEIAIKLEEIDRDGISEADRFYLSEIIDRYRNQVINADMHIMNLEIAQKKEPMGMSNLYVMIQRFDKKRNEEPLSIEVMVEKANNLFGINVRARSRKKDIINARFLTMKWIKETTKYSLKRIGKELGGYDHSSVIHGIAAINDKIPYDKEVSNMWDKLSLL